MGRWSATGRVSGISFHGDSKPGAGDIPIPARGAHGNVQKGGAFFFAEAGEVTKHHNLRLAREALLERFQREADGQDFIGLRVAGEESLFNFNGPRPAAPLHAFVGAGLIDDDLAHDLSNQGKQVVAIVDEEIFGSVQAKICFVDKAGGSHGPVALLGAEAVEGHAAELLIQRLEEGVFGGFVAILPSSDQPGDVFAGGNHGWTHTVRHYCRDGLRGKRVVSLRLALTTVQAA